MMRVFEKYWHVSLVLGLGLGALAVAFGVSAAPPPGPSAGGHGTFLVLDEDGNTVRRQFSFNATQNEDETVSGHATLRNPAFTGEDGNAYQLQVDISCMQVIGNIAFFGGTTRSTNDPNLVDAVYFSVQDNGEPGKNNDLLSGVFFFDDDPETQGDPGLCQFNQVGDFPMEPIDSGNIHVRQ